MGLRSRLPPMAQQHSDSRNRAPKASEDAKTGMSEAWPKSTSKVERFNH